MKLLRWIYRLFVKAPNLVQQTVCFHDWECISGYNLMDTRPPDFRCKKCGKVEGL